MAWRYAHQEAAGRLDRTLDIYIRTHLRQEQSLTRALISLADPPHAAILVAALAGAAALARRWSGVMLLLGGTLTAVVISEVILKPLIGRLRYGHLTFPSGHTTAMAAIATAILTHRRAAAAVSRCGYAPASPQSSSRPASQSHSLPNTSITPPTPSPAAVWLLLSC